jgi:hypothetical protein
MSEPGQTPRSRLDSIELHMPEVEKFTAGLQGGVFEAYETLGVALAGIVEQPNQTDIFMAIIFSLMPETARVRIMADPRVAESQTVLPLLQTIASRNPRH